MKNRLWCAIAFVAALAVGALSSAFYIQKAQINDPFTGPNGDEWLRWSKSHRDFYVTAYVQGLMLGFLKGCESGISSSLPPVDGPEKVAGINRCASHSPLSSQDSIKLVDSITEFYKEYPDERFVWASEILLKLHGGLSVKQIHEQYQRDGYGVMGRGR
jgi:hypothetical protein